MVSNGTVASADTARSAGIRVSGGTSAEAPQRDSEIVDIAFGHLQSRGHGDIRITALTDGIDAPSVTLGQHRWQTIDAWRAAFTEVMGPVPLGSVVIAHPSTWEGNRVEVLLRAARAAWGGNVCVSAVPRATLIATSHLQGTAASCAVLEAADDHLDIHRMVRRSGLWSIVGTETLDVDSADETSLQLSVDPEVLAHILDDSLDAIVVDSVDSRRTASIRDAAEDASTTGRIASVDRELLQRFALPRVSGTRMPEPVSFGRSRDISPRTRRALGALVAIAVIGVIAAAFAIAVINHNHDDTPAAQPPSTSARSGNTVIGRVVVRLPAEWSRASDPPSDTGIIGFTSIEAPHDARRLIIVQAPLSEQATLRSVAASLKQRLDSGAARTISDFVGDDNYANQRVISYREKPSTGQPIRWYVRVAGGLQVSVGCQPSEQASQSVDRACADAVGSMQVRR